MDGSTEKGDVERCETALNLGDLTQSSISRILALTTPKDVCRLAAVSQLFECAASSDTLWEVMLPHNYREILSKAVDPIAFASKKELYFRLCDSILIDAGTKRVWLERSTGKICYMLSARDLSIAWGDRPRHWRWIPQDGSRFEDVAELIQVCWLEIGGRFDCSVLSPNTDYDLSFVIRLRGRNRSLIGVPFKFSLTTQYGDLQESSRCLLEREGEAAAADEEEGHLRTPLRDGNDGWMEYVAGVFTTEKYEDGPTYIEFRMTEVERLHWKSGIFVDGIKIQPNRR